MSIQLDWEIESEKSGAHTATEDPGVVQARRQAQVRFLLTFAVVVGILGGLLAVLAWRLQDADTRIENFLRDTIEAEVAALRIGDWNAFAAAQRSADTAWRDTRQRGLFNEYQTLKAEESIQLNATIRAIEIDGSRARVLVEEIINGTPYVRTWFYWRYEEGWYHVPPDYTFWGEARQYNGVRVTVNYNALDDPFARDLGLSVEGWIDSTCTLILVCGDFPHVTLHVVTDETLSAPRWSAANPWELEIPSPYMTRARYDQPFSGQLKIDTADLLAKRLVEASGTSAIPPVYPADAYYLRPAVVSWLVGRFVALNTSSYLITSLAENYGNGAVGQLLRALPPDGTVAAFQQVTGVERLDIARLDWRDFVNWRLKLENDLFSGPDETAYINLYTPAMAETARQRYQMPYDPNAVLPRSDVTQVRRSVTADGFPQLEASVIFTDADGTQRTEVVLFRLIDNTWKRAS